MFRVRSFFIVFCGIYLCEDVRFLVCTSFIENFPAENLVLCRYDNVIGHDDGGGGAAIAYLTQDTKSLTANISLAL